MDLILIITGGVLLGCLLGLSWFAGSDAPYVPTKKERIKRALKLAGLRKGGIFWELGSGDGRVVLEAAKMGTQSFGVEQSWIRVLWSRWKAKQQNLPNAHFVHGDIFSPLFWSLSLRDHEARFAKRVAKQSGSDKNPTKIASSKTPRNDVMDADVVYIFLLPKAIEKLEPLLKKNLKKGARLITQTFHFKNWKPYKKMLITDKDIPNTPLGKNKLEGDFWIYKI